jgi:Putative adhesin
MTQRRTLATFQAVVLIAVSAIFLISAARASDRQGSFTEEFHKLYPLSAQGRIEIENINGAVHITAWDRDEVKVDALKRASSKRRLDQATIEVRSDKDALFIRTQYPGHDHTFNFGDGDESGNPASVEYTITVPRQARLDEIELINGRLDVRDVSGEVHASCINGRIQADNLQGTVRLSTINGELEANLNHLPSSELNLSSVNGKLRVTLPSDVRAELIASTVSGDISDEFGLPVTRHEHVGRSLHGQLGGGGTRVKLANVNGTIEIRHATDNRPLSPAENLERERQRSSVDKDGDDNDDDNDEI